MSAPSIPSPTWKPPSSARSSVSCWKWARASSSRRGRGDSPSTKTTSSWTWFSDLYSESDLETAIIGQIERFLLEMGKGFLFEARQRRFTFDEDHFFVDLVFYNRLLRCYVLIDLKLGKIAHQDLGQMQMYVNYFDRFVKTGEENSTIGIVLCKRKNKALVEITLPKDANIHAREYQLYLPSKDELQQKLMEWIGDRG